MTQLLNQLDEEADAEYELESAEGSIFSGNALMIGAMTMAWAAVTFAYFYLRELDRGPEWKPAGLRPPPLLGDLIGLAVLGGAVLFTYAVHRLQRGMVFEFEIAAWWCVGCGMTACGLQIWQLTRLGFLPGTSGFTSVFVGFALLNCAFLFFGSLYAETVAARALRLRRMYEPEHYLGVSVLPQVRIWRSAVRACLVFWAFMVLVETFFWVLFYVL